MREEPDEEPRRDRRRFSSAATSVWALLEGGMMAEPLKVLFLSPEVVPYAKTGGLGRRGGSPSGRLEEAGCGRAHLPAPLPHGPKWRVRLPTTPESTGGACGRRRAPCGRPGAADRRRGACVHDRSGGHVRPPQPVRERLGRTTTTTSNASPSSPTPPSGWSRPSPFAPT